MNITIIGTENVALQFAVHCREKGNDVKVYTSKSVSSTLTIINEDGQLIHKAAGIQSSNEIEDCVTNADLIFVTYPAFINEQLEKLIYPYIKCTATRKVDTQIGGLYNPS